MSDLAWIPDGRADVQPACRNHPELPPEAWTTEQHAPLSPDAVAAAVVCLTACPLLADCARYALSRDPLTICGIWGGTCDTDRRRIRRARLKAAREAA